MIFIKILKNTILFGKANPLGKAFEKQMKTNEDQGIKQVEALKVLKPEENKQLKLSEGIFFKDTGTNEIYEIKKWDNKFKELNYKTKNYTYDFQQFETIRTFVIILK